ncbi:hypothetical protein AK830_g6940 [Neonectria ditissima]|uniref:Uncharacterized protein n=1 Tax=Neonectria ditissima TaxID=78410 RepID=A0A0P7BH95_9HYPO|nr:hypothetical protein AK830_g6940 [Neonectria ditissima]
MNRFRGRKKTKDDLATAAASPRPSVESESSSPFKMFGKNKKAPEEEPKPELDLATALPATDDFRTSLLMTGLSARFSMLREQDDPNTKVGKASDDSVLYPKRQSRLMDFGFGGGLSDIAEVESIRAPFARNSSYHSDDAASTSGGSMMARSKPIEGNNLFGGRQKIYKIAANGAKGGATAGRALYDDDVSQSSFQKWRQAERERQSLEERRQADSPELEPPRPESPPQDEYNRRRETSSTTSSVPSAARNSTAATSTTSSQPTASVKDWQSATAAANPTAPIERTVTRTRRLYEQGLNQDLHNQQTSSLSRIDTLSRQRNFGNRTPDLTPTVPSPASATFSERFANTRSIHAKSSAPNLRSFSPPATLSSQTSPVDGQNKFPPLQERASFGATPPLSPPISETGEPQAISAQFSDRNKSAAMSGLSKSSQYDDSRYAQRQIQLQQGRETPTNFFRPESNVSVPSSRSRSSSTHRAPFEKHDSFKTKPVVQEEAQTSTFFDDDDDDQPSLTIPTRPDVLPTPPQLNVERPADNEHPAFRKSALPTPLIFETKLDNSKHEESPEDSPTLGPASGGLSGMVRAHLRQDSNASSNYGSAPNETDLASRFPPERSDIQSFQSMKSNPWESIERGVEMSMDSDLPSPTRSKSSMDPHERGSQVPSSNHDSKTDLDQEKDTDDFARHLADGARRVRERLTSYVESDSGSSAPAPPPISELPPPPRPNALGILKAKSSRGSLVDRTRSDRDTQSQTKAKKLLGLGGPTATPGAYASRPGSFEANDEQNKQEQHQSQSDEMYEDEGRSSTDKDNVHAGLKAFRQARRELQRMKELEIQQRYQASQDAPQDAPPPPPQAAPPSQTAPLPQNARPLAREPPPSMRAPPSRQQSQERRPPPISYNRMPSEESRNGNGSRPGSRAPSERDRSGSGTSSGGRSGSRPARLRNGSVPREDYYAPMGSPSGPGPGGMPRQGPMALRPQHMPNQPFPNGSASPGRFNRFGEPSPNMQANMQPHHYGYEHGQPSPNSPMTGGPSPYGHPGPNSQRPFGGHAGNMEQDPSARRMMRNRDVPDMQMSSSASHGAMGQRDGPRGGQAHQNGMTAPPLPPINPRRKTNIMADYVSRPDEGTLGVHRMPMSPVSADEGRGGHGAFGASDDEGPAAYRQRLRKAASEANGLNSRARSLRNSPPQPMVPPPMPPSVTGNGMPGGMI